MILKWIPLMEIIGIVAETQMDSEDELTSWFDGCIVFM